MKINKQEKLVNEIYKKLKGLNYKSDNDCVDEYFIVNEGKVNEFSMDVGGQYVEFFLRMGPH